MGMGLSGTQLARINCPKVSQSRAKAIRWSRFETKRIAAAVSTAAINSFTFC
jgi:hypothetical protein